MPKPPGPLKKSIDVTKIISKIGESKPSLLLALFVSSEKLAVPVVVAAAVSVYWVFGLMFHLDFIVMY